MPAKELSPVDFKDAAKAVSLALSILRRSDSLNTDERHLLAALQDVYISLVRYGSRSEESVRDGSRPPQPTGDATLA